MKPKTDTSDVQRRVYADANLELRADGDNGAPTVEGYAAVFNSLSEPLFDWNMGKFREKVAPGAFAKTLREQNIPLLVEHADLPLATTRAGTLQLSEDDHGLRFRSVLDPTDPDVMRLIPKMRRGDMNKCSFGFVTVRDSWDSAAKLRVCTLQEVKLFDVSIVANPAYSATEARVRKALADDGLDAESIAELFVRIKQGLPLEADEMVIMRRLVETCQRHLSEMTTAADVAPVQADHPTEAAQPVQPTSAPQQPLHPRSWYEEQFTKVFAGVTP